MKDIDALLDLLRAIMAKDDKAAKAAAARLGMSEVELQQLRADTELTPITEAELEELGVRVAKKTQAELADEETQP